MAFPPPAGGFGGGAPPASGATSSTNSTIPWVPQGGASLPAGGGMLAGLMATSSTPASGGGGGPIAAAFPSSAVEENANPVSTPGSASGRKTPNSKPTTPSSVAAPPVAQQGGGSAPIAVPANIPPYPFGSAPPFAVPANPPPTSGIPSAPSQRGGTLTTGESPCGSFGGQGGLVPLVAPVSNASQAASPSLSQGASDNTGGATSLYSTSGNAPGGAPIGGNPFGSSSNNNVPVFGGGYMGGFGGPTPSNSGGGNSSTSGATTPWSGGAGGFGSNGVSSTVFDFFANTQVKKDKRNVHDREDDFVTLSDADPDDDREDDGKVHTARTPTSGVHRSSTGGSGARMGLAGGSRSSLDELASVGGAASPKTVMTFDVKPEALLDFLYLGNVKDAEDVDFLKEHGITDIINVGMSNYPAPKIPIEVTSSENGEKRIELKQVRLHHFPAHDTSEFPIYQLFEDCFREIDRIRTRYWMSRGHKSRKLDTFEQQPDDEMGDVNTSTSGGGAENRPKQQYDDDDPKFVPYDGDKPPALLLHCEKGISRSATVSIAYLIKRNGWNVTDAHKYVQSKRRIIEPNVGFMEALRNFETRLAQALPGDKILKDAERGYGSKVTEHLTADNADGAKIIQRKKRALVAVIKNLRPDITQEEVHRFYEENVAMVWTVSRRSDGLWMIAFTQLEGCREAATQNRIRVRKNISHPLGKPGEKVEYVAARVHGTANKKAPASK